MNISDYCVYSKLIGLDCVIIRPYVNDMLIFSTHVHVVYESKKLSSLFEMKGTGEADAIVLIKIRKKNDGFSLFRSHYIEKMSKKF